MNNFYLLLMINIFVFILVFELSLEQSNYSTNTSVITTIEFENNTQKENSTKNRSHFEDCSSSKDCKKGFICKLNRCFTSFEINNLKLLGLEDKSVCGANRKPCSSGKKCIKHRCVSYQYELDLPKKKKANDTSVNLLFAGSIFLNGIAYESGAMSNGSFNYDHFFKNIKNIIQNADLAVVDQETIFQTNKTNFTKGVGNTPTELGDAIANAGFKLVLHGTKYAYSKRGKGIINTINFWKDKYPEINVLGISKDLEESKKDYYIFKKNDIKIGIINFSGFKDLIPKEREYFVNVIHREKIQKMVEKLKNKADFVIVCMNWGDKNNSLPNIEQIEYAKKLAENGVKLIIGNHPSLVHQISYVKSKGKKALVFWSLGHLISDSKKKYSYLGALANITISKGKKKAFISDYNMIPIINHKINSTDYSVYKLSEYSQELGLKASANFSMENVTKQCQKVMGNFINDI